MYIRTYRLYIYMYARRVSMREECLSDCKYIHIYIKLEQFARKFIFISWHVVWEFFMFYATLIVDALLYYVY